MTNVIQIRAPTELRTQNLKNTWKNVVKLAPDLSVTPVDFIAVSLKRHDIFSPLYCSRHHPFS
jgi:hypothetical protein